MFDLIVSIGPFPRKICYMQYAIKSCLFLSVTSGFIFLLLLCYINGWPQIFVNCNRSSKGEIYRNFNKSSLIELFSLKANTGKESSLSRFCNVSFKSLLFRKKVL